MQHGGIIKFGLWAALVAVFLTACGSDPKRSPAIGEAYVGPSTLQIRDDTTPQAKVVATVKHGDRVEILQQKRRWFRVRTAAGPEGWTDEHQLLAATDMAALKELAAKASHMPAQGEATTYSDLHVHTQPSYQAPSFFTIKANEKFDVLTYAVLPRTETPRTPLVPPPPKKSKSETRKPSKNAKLQPPPMPKPPGPPPDWLQLSKPTEVEAEPRPAPEQAHPAKAVPTDRWSLIRMSNGQSGWVYTRLITMAIPDEVAQYAEGHRIVAYFPLGAVQDGDQAKTTWLWTTVAAGDLPYDFDSFRVFVWSLRRHRYETAHVELHLKGYLPVLLEGAGGGQGKSRADAARVRPASGFSVCMQKKEGDRYRREYGMANEKVRFMEEHPCEASAPLVTLKAAAPLPDATKAAPPPPKESFMDRVKKRWAGLKKSLFGH